MRAQTAFGRMLRSGIVLLAAGILLLVFSGCAADPLEYIPVYNSSSHSGAVAGDSAQTNCTAADKNTVCTITLTNNKSSVGSLTWSVQSSAPAHATFSPTSGTLAPGQSQTITVTFVGRVCAPSVTLQQSWSAPADGHAGGPFPMLQMHTTGGGC